MDTRASNNHVCGIKELFTKLNESIQGEVTFGDLSNILFKGKGKIMIQTKKGDHNYVLDGYCVPVMRSNILILGQLLEKGYGIHLKDLALTICLVDI